MTSAAVARRSGAGCSMRVISSWHSHDTCHIQRQRAVEFGSLRSFIACAFPLWRGVIKQTGATGPTLWRTGPTDRGHDSAVRPCTLGLFRVYTRSFSIYARLAIRCST